MLGPAVYFGCRRRRLTHAYHEHHFAFFVDVVPRVLLSRCQWIHQSCATCAMIGRRRAQIFRGRTNLIPRTTAAHHDKLNRRTLLVCHQRWRRVTRTSFDQLRYGATIGGLADPGRWEGLCATGSGCYRSGLRRHVSLQLHSIRGITLWRQQLLQ